MIDYAGNCGNLAAAVGVFAIEQGLLTPSVGSPCTVRVWQANLGQQMVIHVPVNSRGEVVSHGAWMMEVNAEVSAAYHPAKIASATVYRTARTLLWEEVVVPPFDFS